jgi:hypothetical protein
MFTQLGLRSRATQETTPAITYAAICASKTEKVRSGIHANLSAESDRSSPIAIFRLFIYASSILGLLLLQQISGELTRSLDLWRPAPADKGVSLLEFTCGMLWARLIDRPIVRFYGGWTRPC